MLVLGREVNEWIDVYAPNGDLLVSVTPRDCTPGRMRIGVDCPREYRVVRRELAPKDAA